MILFKFRQRSFPVSLLTFALLIFLACGKEKKNIVPPEAALSTFELAPGFKIELIASEPLLSDPVDMEIDEDGKLYVVEMHGYPLDKSGTGIIRILSDTTGDGKMDKSTIFASNLVLPNSIMRWKKGLLVTDAPNVLYLEDTDGDGKADKTDTVLTGFALSNPQHNLNSPVLGIDNWIYLGHEGAVATQTYAKEFGDAGREIYYADQPRAPRLGTNADGRSVRFRPATHQLELTSSNTQFGHTFDTWGHHFLVHNANHVIEEVIAQPYIARNPDLLIPDASQSISDHGEAAEVFPITQNPQNQLLTDVGVITSACGILSYTGGAFSTPYDDNVIFVAEPVSNLVHVDKLSQSGATFKASRILEHKEFLASTDFRFRPVNTYIGPDGALYIVDYYRQIIEHPEWMSDDVVKSGELYNDTNKGRIYRISATNATASNWTKGISLGKSDNNTLVEQLANPNSWWRNHAQRLLIDRNALDAVPALLKMTQQPVASGRLHALWTLEGLGKLTPDQITNALKDPIPGIRENAIRLAELHLSDFPVLAKSLIALQTDPDSKVRYQLLCALGSLNTMEAANARNQILFHDLGDPWIQIAALSAGGDPNILLQQILERYPANNTAYASMLSQLTRMIGIRGNEQDIKALIKKGTQIKPGNSLWQADILNGLADGIHSGKNKLPALAAERQLLINSFFNTNSEPLRQASLALLKAMTPSSDASFNKATNDALTIAADVHQSELKRAAAIDLLTLNNPKSYESQLMHWLSPAEPLSVQLATLRTLSEIPDTVLAVHLVSHWAELTPDVRDAAIATFLTSEARTPILLTALESGKIQTTDVAWPRQVHLMAQRNESLRNRARAIFTKNNDAEINKAYQTALSLKGDVVNGQAVYQKNCAICHQVRGKLGIALGPDLGTIHNWSTEAIMANVLAPNLSISSGFDLWAVELKSGETIQGIIATETPGAITLRNSGTPERTISRADIKNLKALNMSAMTNGLDKQINQQEMADLLAFLKANK